jgi:1,4-dihydroxy-2-naphthoyl-CoA hydrolase
MGDSPPLAELAGSIPFATTLGIDLVTAGADEVVATMPWSADKTTIGGRLHGGALMALADNVGAVCAFCNLPTGATTSTIESKTNFFRGVSSGTVTATSKPVHVGNTTIVVRTDLVDDRGKLVASVTQTQIVLPRQPDAPA